MASSIKLFSFNQKHLHVIGIYPRQSNQNGPSINWRNRSLVICFLLYVVPSAAFFVFEAKSMLDYGSSFYAISSGFFLMCIYLVLIWKMENISTFIETCERFVEKRESSIIAYRELIVKIERLCELLDIAGVATTFSTALPFLLYSLVNYYIFDLGEKSFFLSFPVKWPFDWKTPLGYFVVWLAQLAGCTAIALTIMLFLNWILGSCWLFIVMAEDITKDLVAFTPDAETRKNHAEWTKRYCDILQIYSDAKQCVDEFNAIVKYSLFIYIFHLMLSVSSLLVTLQFQFWDENAKLLETLMISIMAFWIFGMLFFVCELGERMTYQFDMFDQELERCDWLVLPIEMQRMHLIFLSDTQQPKHIACYGNILCIRDTFKKITNKGFSFFMTLRKFEI